MAAGRALPRGPHTLAREEVLASQRGRMLDGIAQVVAAKGYGAATVADVIQKAGVSRKTFYEHFSGKEDCFLQAYDAGVEVLMATMTAAGDDLRSRIAAYLQTLAAEPAFARTFLLEIAAAGPRALERRREVHDAFAALGQGAGMDGLAVVGATQEVVTRWVVEGRTADLPELEDDVVRWWSAVLER